MGGYAAAGAVGNVLGLLIGAAIVTHASWKWVFFSFAIMGGTLVIAVSILCPNPVRPKMSAAEKARAYKRLDLVGVSTLTAGLVLFIFAVTSGSSIGWATARCLAPLVISVFTVAAFFYWETIIPEEDAAVPPSLWKGTNFSVLIAAATVPFFWWGSVQLQFAFLWQEVYGWSAMKAAVHL